MSYEPTNWKTGDVVTSDKLNKLENAVASAVGGSYLDVHETNGILDKTWQEIYNAFASGIEVRMIYEWTESGKSGIAREFVESIGIGDDQTPYMVFCGGPYAAQKPSDYPVHQE